MNWKKLNEKYKKAFLEWVNKGLRIETKRIESSDMFNSGLRYEAPIGIFGLPIDKVDVLKLPYYFDSLGIFIEPTKDIDGIICGIIDNELTIVDSLGPFPDRLAATKAGIEKAFEIREKQLNANQQ